MKANFLRAAILLSLLSRFWWVPEAYGADDNSSALLAAVKADLGESHPVFRQAFVDLDVDGRLDAIVLLKNSDHCGSGGCDMIIFHGTPQGFKKVSSSTVTREPIQVLTDRSQGWKVLVVESAGDRLMRFNGSRFPLNPSVQPKATVPQLKSATVLPMTLNPNSWVPCMRNEQGLLHNYEGLIGSRYPIRMTLVYKGDVIEGSYFYESQQRDITLRGRINSGTNVVLDELDDKGNASARFEGHSSSFSPQSQNTSSACEVIDGVWHKTNSSQNLGFSVNRQSTDSGSLDHRYAVAGVQNDAFIEGIAKQFQEAVKRADKNAVASLIKFPIQIKVHGNNQTLRTADELIRSYDSLFSSGYRQMIAQARTLHMDVDKQGIRFSYGKVVIDSSGKIIRMTFD